MSSLANTLVALLKTCGKNKVPISTSLPAGEWAPGTIILSYKANFYSLWRLLDRRLDVVANGSVDLVLIWDGLPDEGQSDRPEAVSVEHWLTAYDWLVAFSLTSRSDLSVRLFVIDLGVGLRYAFAEKIAPQ